MRKAIRFPGKPFRKRYSFLSLKHILGYTLLLLCLSYPYKDSPWINNGSGGTDWKIGKPQVTLWNASQARSQSELGSFALKLINRDRQINGLPILVEDPLLTESAQRHAEDMKARKYYDHVTPEGKTPSDRFIAVGGQGGVGENIMLQSGNMGTTLTWGLVETFQKSWMYSDGHRANLLAPQYTRVGYGIVSDPMSGKIYAVQNFQ
ncbi:hypothetical protein LEP3755_35930 [Leptolyngbya sp. NIES-3755]|nr:hypothetical protein LEP3755_35930 [Leptolyngbya sp. NIES-3755]